MLMQKAQICFSLLSAVSAVKILLDPARQFPV